MNLGPIIAGLGKARIGFNQGVQQRQQDEQERVRQAMTLKQQMVRIALEDAARTRTQANSDRTYNLSQERLDLERNRKPVHEQISARVKELVGQGTPLLD